MKELVKELAPYVLPVLSGLLGWGSTVKYYRVNGNGKWNGQSERRSEPLVTQSNCKLRHIGIEKELKGFSRRMGEMTIQMQGLNNTIIKHYEKP